MKRLHVHVSVDDLAQSVRFYSTLFATEPTVTQSDYAKWMLDDPRVNFAISTRNARKGVDHFGIQVETRDELQEVYRRLQKADRPVLDEGETVCCYAQSEKAWIADPQGVPWEAFLTTGASTVYGTDIDLSPITDAACCTSATPQGACCAPKPALAPEVACCGGSA
jgi:hypothetical protein